MSAGCASGAGAFGTFGSPVGSIFYNSGSSTAL